MRVLRHRQVNNARMRRSCPINRRPHQIGLHRPVTRFRVFDPNFFARIMRILFISGSAQNIVNKHRLGKFS